MTTSTPHSSSPRSASATAHHWIQSVEGAPEMPEAAVRRDLTVWKARAKEAEARVGVLLGANAIAEEKAEVERRARQKAEDTAARWRSLCHELIAALDEADAPCRPEP